MGRNGNCPGAGRTMTLGRRASARRGRIALWCFAPASLCLTLTNASNGLQRPADSLSLGSPGLRGFMGSAARLARNASSTECKQSTQPATCAERAPPETQKKTRAAMIAAAWLDLGDDG